MGPRQAPKRPSSPTEEALRLSRVRKKHAQPSGSSSSKSWSQLKNRLHQFGGLGAGMREAQADLFGPEPGVPAGFRYEPDLIDEAEEGLLVRQFETLQFAPFQFHGFEGKRRVVFFGSRYDFNAGGGLEDAEDMPPFLVPVRDKAALAFGLEPVRFSQVLVTEYSPGAAIGWHKDRSVFGDVIGISLVSTCRFRFRKRAGSKWD